MANTIEAFIERFSLLDLSNQDRIIELKEVLIEHKQFILDYLAESINIKDQISHFKQYLNSLELIKYMLKGIENIINKYESL